MMPADALRRLDELGVRYELTQFPAEAFTAKDVALALQIKLAQVAKAMLFSVDKERYGVAVVPGDRRVNCKELAKFYGGGPVSLVRREDVSQVSGLSVGAVTPLIRFAKPELDVILDEQLLRESSINISTGDLRLGLSLNPGHLAEAVGARVGLISE